MPYTKDQISQYLAYISYPEAEHLSNKPLELLTNLQARQLCRVPFESTSLHYSTHRTLSLDHDDLFHKIVVRQRGGYCMELNALFGVVLSSLGFNVYNAGARVKNGERYTGWSHMVNIVTIEGTRYLVDVGFGSDGPGHPLPIEHNWSGVSMPPRHVLLEHRALAQHTDPAQRLWVYSTRESAAAEEGWRERYAFSELEFFPEDYAVMNLSTMTMANSFFVQTVLASLFLPEGGAMGGQPVGVVTLHKDEVKRRVAGSSEMVEKLENEADRVRALDRYFGIKLTDSEQRAIRGWPTELREE